MISVIVPSFKRVEQTKKTIELLLSSEFSSNTPIEIIISDATPDDSLRLALVEAFGTQIIYTQPSKPGVAASKNHGARSARYPVLVFCDSDIEVEKDTLALALSGLQKDKTAGMVGGNVVWKGGALNGEYDRPRSEDRMQQHGESTYIEALYSRFVVTYTDVFRAVGGYDDQTFNMRGEGSDLSVRYWRAGYPLVFLKELTVHHVHDAPDSVALRVDHPEWGIAKDLLLLSYKYHMTSSIYPNFEETIRQNFKHLQEKAPLEMLYGILHNIDFITQQKKFIDSQAYKEPLYDFKFLEIFSHEELFHACVESAALRIEALSANSEVRG